MRTRAIQLFNMMDKNKFEENVCYRNICAAEQIWYGHVPRPIQRSGSVKGLATPDYLIGEVLRDSNANKMERATLTQAF